MSSNRSLPPDVLVAQWALGSQRISSAQWKDVLKTWTTSATGPLGDVLVREGLIQEAELAQVPGLSAARKSEPWNPSATERFKPLPSLGKPVSDHSGTTLDALDGPYFGTRYEVASLLGQGGVGRVWRVRDNDLLRDVALKEGRDRAELAQSLLRREAQVTGQLEHPHIVPVYEFVRAEGAPSFYTMRLFRGATLQSAVDAYHAGRASGEQKPLELRRLLSAFVSICQAVGYAHSRGVLHRDLKPENIMLGDFGEVLVVDWGLAKLRDAEPGGLPIALGHGVDALPQTMQGAIVGTPGYMAPEQALGELERIDERTDTFGLGGILYTILTGHVPFEGETVLDRLGRVVFADPRSVRAVNPSIPRNLEAICLQSLTKDPEGRFARALDLAEEVNRWLADEPVKSYRESWPDRLGRFARKHRAWTQAGIAALLIISVVSLVAVWQISLANQRVTLAAAETREQYRQAQAARVLSEKNYILARKAVDQFFTFASTDQRLSSEGLQSLQAKLFEEVHQFYRVFLETNPDDPSLREVRAGTFRQLAEAQRALGLPGALENYQKSLTLETELSREQPDNLHRALNLGRSLFVQGHYHYLQGDLASAERLLTSARDLFSQLVAKNPAEREYHANLARATHELGLIARGLGKIDEARERVEAAVKTYEKLVQHEPENTVYQVDLAHVLTERGPLYPATTHFSIAEKSYRDALAICEPLQAKYPRDFRVADTLGATQYALALLYFRVRDLETSNRYFVESSKTFEELARRHPAVLRYQLGLGKSICKVASTYARQGQTTLAQPNYQRGLEVLRRLAADYPDQGEFAAELAPCEMDYGNFLLFTGDLPAARQSLEYAAKIRRKILQEAPEIALNGAMVIAATHNLAVLHNDAGQFEKAGPLIEEALRLLAVPRYARAFAEQGNTLAKPVLWFEYAKVAQAQNDVAQYETRLRTTLAEAEVVSQAGTRAAQLTNIITTAQFELGRLCVQQERFEEADTALAVAERLGHSEAAAQRRRLAPHLAAPERLPGQ